MSYVSLATPNIRAACLSMARKPDNFWTAARQIASPIRRSVAKPKDIFRGQVQYDKALIAGVKVFRITVVPPGTGWPRSYAIDETSPMRWRHLKLPPNLLLDWRQESASRWMLEWSIKPKEQCWGLGERYSGLNLRGRVHTLFATDDDQHLESTDSLYMCIPWLSVLENEAAYGVFLDSPAPQRWDLDSDRSGIVRVRLLTRRPWCLYWFERSSLPKLVAAYTQLTGRCQLPPLWSLGHQQSRWSYPTEQSVRRLANEFRSREIPCDTIVIDIDYMDDYRVFTISRKRFPQFEKLIAALSRVGFHVVTIVNPGVKKLQREMQHFAKAAGFAHFAPKLTAHCL